MNTNESSSSTSYPPEAPVHPLQHQDDHPLQIKVNSLKKTSSSASNSLSNRRRAPISDISVEPASSKNISESASHTPKSKSSVDTIERALHGQFLFKSVGSAEITEIVSVMHQVVCTKNEKVITQGSSGNSFYVLEFGTCDILVNDQVVGSYAGGDSFGELALMYNCPRAATIIVTSDSAILWNVDRLTFRRILATTAASSQVARVNFLRNVPLLQPLSNNQVQTIAGALKTETFDTGAVVITQGDVDGNSFYLILEGTVKVTSTSSGSGKTKDLMDMGPGDYFGEMALMLNEPRQANVIATSPLTCYTLDRRQFTELLGPLKALLDRQMRIRVLRVVPLLKALSDTELDTIANELAVSSFTDGDRIISAGEPGSKIYIISDGTVNVSKDGKHLMNLSSGDFFGERALLNNEPRAADCIAVGSVECLTLDRAAFEAHLGSLSDILEKEMKRQQMMQECAQTPQDSSSLSTSSSSSSPAKVGGNIKLEELSIKRKIGTGTFGRVFMVTYNKTTLALKCMQKATVVSAHQQRNVMYEKSIVAECDHPFILKLHETYSDSNQLYMLFELVQGGELWSLLYEKAHLLPEGPHGSFDVKTSRFYAANLVSCFAYLEQLGVAYRDLKPENLLIDKDGYLKMVDFGFAKHIPYYKGSSLCSKSFTLCGTPEYLSPELILSKGHGKSVDHWALGCLIYELLVGHTPFQDDEQPRTFEKIVNVNTSLAFPDKFDPVAKDLIIRLLHPNPALRLGSLAGGVNDIKNHEWFRNVHFNWDYVESKKLSPPFVPPITDANDCSNFDEYPEDTNVLAYDGPDFFEGF